MSLTEDKKMIQIQPNQWVNMFFQHLQMESQWIVGNWLVYLWEKRRFLHFPSDLPLLSTQHQVRETLQRSYYAIPVNTGSVGQNPPTSDHYIRNLRISTLDLITYFFFCQVSLLFGEIIISLTSCCYKSILCPHLFSLFVKN